MDIGILSHKSRKWDSLAVLDSSFITSFPKEIKPNLTESVSMMCRVSDNVQTRASSSAVDVSHISSIFISRGDGDDVASVTVFDPPTALADLSNMEVKGSLSALSGEG